MYDEAAVFQSFKGTFRENINFCYYWSHCSEIWYNNIICNTAPFFPMKLFQFWPWKEYKFCERFRKSLNNISFNSFEARELFFIWISTLLLYKCLYQNFKFCLSFFIMFENLIFLFLLTNFGPRHAKKA